MKRQIFRILKIAVLVMSSSAVCAVAQITPSDDAYISTVSPTTNYGGSGSVLVQSRGGTGFIRFDPSRFPPGPPTSTLSKATPKIFLTAPPTSRTLHMVCVTGAREEETIQ